MARDSEGRMSGTRRAESLLNRESTSSPASVSLESCLGAWGAVGPIGPTRLGALTNCPSVRSPASQLPPCRLLVPGGRVCLSASPKPAPGVARQEEIDRIWSPTSLDSLPKCAYREPIPGRGLRAISMKVAAVRHRHPGLDRTSRKPGLAYLMDTNCHPAWDGLPPAWHLLGPKVREVRPPVDQQDPAEPGAPP